MKFSVGYPIHNEISFYELLTPYLDGIAELYFSWEGFASGRIGFGADDFSARAKLEADLARFAAQGIRLDLLLNGNCYGGGAVSQALRDRVCRTVDYLGERFGLQIVTTTSPFIAETVKTFFPAVETRASVNMWIGESEAMSFCADVFDSFYLQREQNRSPAQLRALHEWCTQHQKGLYLLANSGCLPNCPYHTFHDNLVAHEEEVARTANVEAFNPYVCRRVYSQEENRWRILAGSFVRPEDTFHYEGLVDGVKLATRIHPFPAVVVGAYVRGRFAGDLCALTEPGFGKLCAPYLLDNSAVPADFWQQTADCGRHCDDCGYCRRVYDAIRVKAEE